MKLKNILGQSGMGLIPVMAAIAGTGALTYFLIGQSDINSKTQSKANFDHSVDAQIQQIKTELADYVNCTASFADLRFGTVAAPTVLTSAQGIFKGTLGPTLTVIKSPIPLYRLKAPNAIGAYIEKMSLLSRKDVIFDSSLNTYVEKDMRDVLRIEFVYGNLDGAGTVRPGPKASGATKISKDLIIVSEKAAGKIVTCYFDETNSVQLACEKVLGSQWNESTKKCELPNAIYKSDLTPLWSMVTGAITTIKPADVANGRVSCKKSSKRCSRTNADCNLPACPTNHYRSSPWEADEKEGLFNKKCMKYANCMYQAQPAGYIPKL